MMHSTTMDLDSVYAYLFSLRRFGVKWGLGPIAHVMRQLGSPQRTFQSVHIAGTNGKGSTAAMTEAILRAHGVHCGLFVSPHLERFNERIQVNGNMITDLDVTELVQRVRDTGIKLSFFEMTTAICFLYFALCNVDIAVIEVGLGGRLDATQWIHPCASALTSLGADHALALTTDPLRVAWEKASIAAPGVPFVLPPNLAPDTLRVVLNTLVARGARAVQPGVDWDFVPVEGGTRVRWLFGTDSEMEFAVPLVGAHQAANCAVALTLARLALGHPLTVKNPFVGFSWPGRLEYIDGVYLDGGHNPAALEHLVRTLIDQKIAPLPVMVGFMADKDVRHSLRILSQAASGFICTQVDAGERVLPAQQLAQIVEKLHLPLIACEPDLARALVFAPRPALVAGSFYLVGRARSLLRLGVPNTHSCLSDPTVLG